jgi:hypothetical protein
MIRGLESIIRKPPAPVRDWRETALRSTDFTRNRVSRAEGLLGMR